MSGWSSLPSPSQSRVFLLSAHHLQFLVLPCPFPPLSSFVLPSLPSLSSSPIPSSMLPSLYQPCCPLLTVLISQCHDLSEPVHSVSPTGDFSGRHYFHLMCSVHRSLPGCHQRPDVLWNDRKLFFHHCQTCSYLGWRFAVGTSGNCPPAAEQGRFGL